MGDVCTGMYVPRISISIQHTNLPPNIFGILGLRGGLDHHLPLWADPALCRYTL